MKNIFKKFIGVLFIAVFVLTLVGCTSDKITASYSSDTLSVTRNKIVVDLKVKGKVTNANKLKKCVKASLNSYNEDGDADTVVSSKTITALNTTLTYSSLKSNTKYQFKVETCDGNNYTVLKEDFTTTSLGENAENPIEIKTIKDFENIANDLSAYYVLANDIDFQYTTNDNNEQEEYNFNTIGNTTNIFSGTFDGQGYTLSNITGFDFKTSTQKVYGLFGVNEGTIKNLKVNNIKNNQKCSVENEATCEADPDQYSYTYKYTDFYMGAIAGQNKGVIENVTVTGVDFKVRSNKKYTSYTFDIGGLVGRNNRIVRNSSVEGSINVTEIKRKAYIGGAVGYSTQNNSLKGTPIIAEVASSVNTYVYLSYGAAVRLGGFIGESDSSEIIRDSYSTGKVEAVVTLASAEVDKDFGIGGFAGYISGGDVRNVYASGEVKAKLDGYENVQIGGLVGATIGYSVVKNSFTTSNIDVTVVKAQYNSYVSTETINGEEKVLHKISVNPLTYLNAKLSDTVVNSMIPGTYSLETATITILLKGTGKAVLDDDGNETGVIDEDETITVTPASNTKAVFDKTTLLAMSFDEEIWDLTNSNAPIFK